MRRILLAIVTSFVLFVTSDVPVRADGGPVITDQDVWRELEEILPGGISEVFSILSTLVAVTLGTLVIFASLVGLFTAGMFARWHKSQSRALEGYVKVVMLSNVSYVVVQVIGVIVLDQVVG